MYAVGLAGICLGLMALLWGVFVNSPQPPTATMQVIAQNYAVAQGAVQEAVLAAVAKAPPLPPGAPLLEGASCVLPLSTSTACDLPLGTGRSADIAALLPPAWDVLVDTKGEARWKSRIQEGMVFVYGVVKPEEMAALREMLGHSANLALCRQGADGAACLPVLQKQQPNGTLSPLTLPPDVAAAGSDHFAVHVVQIVP